MAKLGRREAIAYEQHMMMRPLLPLATRTLAIVPIALALLPMGAHAERPREAAGPDTAPWIVVLGNVNSGRTVWSQGGADLPKRVEAMAAAVSPSGWKTLLSARTAGAGAAVCVPNGSEVRFFTVFPRTNYRIALREARKQARVFAASVHRISYSCGAWLSTNQSPAAKPAGVTEYLKSGLYQLADEDCDTSLPPIVMDMNGLRGGPDALRALKDASAKGKRCKIEQIDGGGIKGG